MSCLNPSRFGCAVVHLRHTSAHTLATCSARRRHTHIRAGVMSSSVTQSASPRYGWTTTKSCIMRGSVRREKLTRATWGIRDWFLFTELSENIMQVSKKSDRIQLRHDLQCKPFQWYLDTVYPELDYALPGDMIKDGSIEAVAFDAGRVRGKFRYFLLRRSVSTPISRATCLDHNNPDSHDGQRLSSFVCHGQGGNQYFTYTKLNEIRQSGDHEMCLTVHPVDAQNAMAGMTDSLVMSRFRQNYSL